MKIRLYRDSDRPAVIALWNEVFPNPAPRNDPGRAIDRKQQAGDQLFFVATGEPTTESTAEPTGEPGIVGTVMGGYDGHRGWIYSLAVAPSHRHQGIARDLMGHVEQQLRSHGCPKINLQVLPDNQAVITFYQQLGFHVEERISMGKILPE